MPPRSTCTPDAYTHRACARNETGTCETALIQLVKTVKLTEVEDGGDEPLAIPVPGAVRRRKQRVLRKVVAEPNLKAGDWGGGHLGGIQAG